MKEIKLSLVVPCYNEEESLPFFYREICKIAEEMKLSHQTDFEFIFVDGGSSDGTLKLLKTYRAADQRVRYVSFSRNFGKEAAIYAGLSAAFGGGTMSPCSTRTCRPPLPCFPGCWMNY